MKNLPLKEALRQAVDDRILERNEAALVKLPRVPRFEPRILYSAEFAGFWRIACQWQA